MRYFTLPSDFKNSTIDRIYELNKSCNHSKVIETYGNITLGNQFGSGRSLSQLPKVDFIKLKEYIKYSISKGIDFDYTFNTSLLNNSEFSEEGILRIKVFLSELYDSGVRNITATLPSLIKIINSMNLDFKIKCSAICSIDTANKALEFKSMGVDRIVVKELVNRDFETLKRIRRAFGERVELIVNTPCHIDCHVRMSHYNQQACDSISETNPVSFNFYEHLCMLRRYGNTGNWLKINFIRPEDLKYYEKIGINFFKIQGRQTFIKGGDVVKVAECYFKEDFDGDLVDLINCFSGLNNFKVTIPNKSLDGFLKPFYEKENFCTHDCSSCDYCDVFLENIVDINLVKNVCEMATQFYQDFDQFEKLLQKAKPTVFSDNTDTIFKTDEFDF